MGKRSVYHFIPEEETIERRLQSRLASCQRCVLASAFFTFGGFRSLRPSLEQALEGGARVTFLLGRFDFVTEPRAVDGLLRIAGQYPKQLGIYFDADFGFHFKLAVFTVNRKEIVIIGSSNLTPKGLSTVGEANLEIAGNGTVYRQATELLQRRLKEAVPAQSIIDDYRRRYNRAKRYRQLRSRWENRGRAAWSLTRSITCKYSSPEGTRFAFCWIGTRENDKRLIDNIRKEHANALASGYRFPDQWVHTEIPFARRINECEYFVVCDDFSRSFGFAICTRKYRILDAKDRREPVIFYRFRRGWKAQFRSKDEYEREYKRLGFVDREAIGEVISKRLRRYFQERRR